MTTHAHPLHGQTHTPCCGVHVLALPPKHKLTWQPDRVTCGKEEK